MGAFIVSGCSIATSGNLQAIAPGIVFLDGQLQRFAGVAATVNLLPAEMVRREREGARYQDWNCRWPRMQQRQPPRTP